MPRFGKVINTHYARDIIARHSFPTIISTDGNYVIICKCGNFGVAYTYNQKTNAEQRYLTHIETELEKEAIVNG